MISLKIHFFQAFGFGKDGFDSLREASVSRRLRGHSRGHHRPSPRDSQPHFGRGKICQNKELLELAPTKFGKNKLKQPFYFRDNVVELKRILRFEVPEKSDAS